MLGKLMTAKLYAQERVTAGSGPIHAASLAFIRYSLTTGEYNAVLAHARDVAAIVR